MKHGRVYACTAKCDNTCLEAHWHIVTRNVLYSYIAHLSPDGKVLNHLGMEYGYQYNSMPGTPNFRKTVCFTAKLVSPDGQLLKNEHPNKAVENCIYCQQPFHKLLL
ncbi:hypothetical protein STCU_06390 [Strigomonas culicis]|nr:hypothetical protein STCU_06390 [Strigomonas culicis]|eukprot:EPY25961.1 hypothetical protein STCU_06390 [Strigomonas culicis]